MTCTGGRRSTAERTRCGCSLADVDRDRAAPHRPDRRMEIVRLGQGVDKTGRLAPEALARTHPPPPRLRGHHHGQPGGQACGWLRPAPPGTPVMRPSSPAWSRTIFSASRPRSSPGDSKRRCLSFTGATAEFGAPVRLPGRSCLVRHRRRLDRVGARRLPGRAAQVARLRMQHRLRPDDRAAPARGPAGPGGDDGRIADIDAALDEVAAAKVRRPPGQDR